MDTRLLLGLLILRAGDGAIVRENVESSKDVRTVKASSADASAAMLYLQPAQALVTTRVGAGTNATGSLCRALICFNWQQRAALALACRPACRSAAAAQHLQVLVRARSHRSCTKLGTGVALLEN